MKVKIVSGGYGYRPAGSTRTKLALAGSVVDVSESEADRLIAVGAAVLSAEMPAEGVATLEADVDAEDVGENPPEAENAAEGDETPDDGEALHLDAEQLMSMTLEQLKALAKDMGVYNSKLKSKTALVEAIAEVEVIPGEVDDVPPVIEAAGPVE